MAKPDSWYPPHYDDLENLSGPATTLLEGFRKMPKPVFAVIDGARFYDLRALLKDKGLSCQSLFLEHADEAIERAGGWLVPINDEEALVKILRLPEAAEAMVLWSCPPGEQALYRHLRGLNVVLIPNDNASPEPVAEDDATVPARATEQRVMFRHYDPEVVNSLLPIMDVRQHARFFGPATQFMWYSSQYSNRRRASRPEDFPVAPRGPLRFSVEQIAELEESRNDSSVVTIMSFLRKVDPNHSAGLTDQGLSQFVNYYIEDGRALGIRSERALAYWCYLNLYSREQLARDRSFRDFMLNNTKHGSPDDKIFTLMERLSELPRDKG